MFTWLYHQSHRMEAYALSALLLGSLSFSHTLGYWPIGIAPASPVASAESSLMDILRLMSKIVPGLLFATVGVLYYFAHKPKKLPAPSTDPALVTAATTLREKYETVLGSARHWESRCNLAENQLAKREDDVRTAREEVDRLNQHIKDLLGKQPQMEDGDRSGDIRIAVSSPQGGTVFPLDHTGQWYFFAASVENLDHGKSLCDLVIRLEYTLDSGAQTNRSVERALQLGRDRGSINTQNIARCLPPQESTTIVLAAWKEGNPVQAVDRWDMDPPAVLSPGGVRNPIGAELYRGIWKCSITVEAQNARATHTISLLVDRSVSIFMPPPGVPAKKA
jgi:hypothetical protein